MIKRNVLDRFRDLIVPDEIDEEDDDLDYPVENLINIALNEFKKWASPSQYRKLLDALSTTVHRKSETRLYYNLKLFSKNLGDVPREILEEVIESIEPETVVEKVPKLKDGLAIGNVTLVNNIEGKVYYEAEILENPDDEMKSKVCVFDGEFVDWDFSNDKQFEGASFIYGEAYIADTGEEQFVVYMDKKGRTYDKIDHLFEFDVKKLAYHARSDEDQFIVIEDKSRFGQFDYSVYTNQIIKEHAKDLSRRGAMEIVNALDRINPIVQKKTMRLVNLLKRFGAEFLNSAQRSQLNKIIKSYYKEK